MLQISSGQMRDLAEQVGEHFVRRAMQHLRREYAERCEGKDDAALDGYVRAMIAFARDNAVERQHHVLRLIDLQLTTGFSHDLCGYARYRLSQPGIDEETRVHNFGVALVAPRTPVLISLKSDLAALGAQNG